MTTAEKTAWQWTAAAALLLLALSIMTRCGSYTCQELTVEILDGKTPAGATVVLSCDGDPLLQVEAAMLDLPYRP